MSLQHTTQEERDRRKFKRRFNNLRDLLAGMQKRCRRSQRTLEIGKKTLGILETSGIAEQFRNQIRLAN